MAGLNVTPDQIATARSAGYSDAEIVQHLAPKAPEQFDTALKAGYSPTEILQHFAPEQSGVADNFRQGVSEGMTGIGNTLEQYTGKGPVGTWLQDKGKAIAPPNFVPSPLVDENGVHPSNILRSLARVTPGAVATLGAMSAAPEALGTAGALAVGTGVGTLMSAGDAAKARAVARTGDQNAVPNASDKAIGGGTALAGSAIQALPGPRLLAPGAGAVATKVIGNTGLKGVADAATKALMTTGYETAAGGASNALSQAGTTIGTPGGLSVDPTQVANAAATSGVMGGAFAAKRALPEVLDASKFSGITPDLKPAATQFANRMVDAADGRNLQGTPVFSSAAQRAGEDSFTKAKAAVQSELGDAVSSLKTALPTDAQNILHGAMTGKMPTPGAYDTLKSALASDPQGANVVNLVQQAHAADILGDTGNHYNGKFTGNGAGALGHALTAEHATKTALVAAIGGEAGHLITFSPEMLAAAAGATVGKRLLDNMTGAQAPAGRITRLFADGGQTPVRLNVPQTPPNNPPNNGPGPSPFGGPPMAGGPGTTPMLPPAIQAQMALRANLAKQAAVNAPAAPVAAPPAPSAINPLALPTSITGPSRAIVRGAMLAQKQKADTLGGEAAKAEVNASPYIAQKLDGASLPSPAAAKYMRQAMGSANALDKIRSDPEAEANDKAEAKAMAADAKLAAKAKPAAPAGPPQITGITKSAGNIGTKTETPQGDEYTIPRSPYAHLVPSAAAHQFLADAQNGGATIASKQGFLNGTQRNISDIRARASAVGRETGLNPQELAAQFEGVSTQKDAIRHREWLKKQAPQAAASLDQHFSDEVIQGDKTKSGIWKRVGK